jgi:hypothetical protein
MGAFLLRPIDPELAFYSFVAPSVEELNSMFEFSLSKSFKVDICVITECLKKTIVYCIYTVYIYTSTFVIETNTWLPPE